MSTVQELAADIVRRHRGRERFLSMREQIGEDLPLAYDIQCEVNQSLGPGTSATDKAAGYKIGLTTPRMQAMCGIDQPVAGVVYAGRIHDSPASLAVAPFMRLGVESEIAVQVAQPLPAGNLDPAEVLACLSQVCAAFELIEDSEADYTKLDAVSLIADNAWNAGLVLGPATPAKDFARLKDRAGVLFRNGEAFDRGSSSDVMGDPLKVIGWLAQHLATRGVRLRPGQWITTGSIVTTKFVVAGERYRFEVEGLAPVELAIA